MEGKENAPSKSNLVEERRRQLEEYVKAKKAKRENNKIQSTDKQKPNSKLPLKKPVGPISNASEEIPFNNIKDSNSPTKEEMTCSLSILHDVVQNVVDKDENYNIPRKDYIACDAEDVNETEVTVEDDVIITKPICDTATLPLIEESSNSIEKQIIDWKKPVCLSFDGRIEKLPRPNFNDNKFQDAKKQELMSMMKNVLEKCSVLLSKDLEPTNQEENTSIHHSVEQIDELPSTPKTKMVTSISSMISPKTPELQMQSIIEECQTPKTPDDDEETLRMAKEIEEVVKRTPAIQKITPPTRKFDFLTKAVTAIKDTSLYCNSRDISKTPTRKNTTEEVITGGSKYLYAMIIPSKRVQRIMESEVVVSPVRRSNRVCEKSSTMSRDNLFEKLEEIPNLAQVGYLPNAAIYNKMKDSDGRRFKVKNDPYSASMGDTPKKKSPIVKDINSNNVNEDDNNKMQ